MQPRYPRKDLVSNMPRIARAALLIVVAFAVGGLVWFGVQKLSGQNNFSDQINPLYLLALYGASFGLGALARNMSVVAGMTMPFSQVISFVIYPNVGNELTNFYPITGGLIFLIAMPAILAAHLGGRLRDRRSL